MMMMMMNVAKQHSIKGITSRRQVRQQRTEAIREFIHKIIGHSHMAVESMGQGRPTADNGSRS